MFLVTLESLHSLPLLARIVEMLGMGSLQTIDVRPFTKWWQGDSFHPEDVAKIGNLHALVSIILFQGKTGNSILPVSVKNNYISVLSLLPLLIGIILLVLHVATEEGGSWYRIVNAHHGVPRHFNCRDCDF